MSIRDWWSIVVCRVCFYLKRHYWEAFVELPEQDAEGNRYRDLRFFFSKDRAVTSLLNSLRPGEKPILLRVHPNRLQKDIIIAPAGWTGAPR